MEKLYSKLKPEFIGFSGGARTPAKKRARKTKPAIKYALFSDIAYARGDDDKAALLSKYNPGGNWTLDKDLTGRDASVFYNTKTKELVVAARGTDLASKDSRYRDLASDLGIVLGVSRFGKRNKEISNLVDKAAEKYNTQPNLTGHSLGGRVAADIARSKDLKAVVFNPGSSPIDIVPALLRRVGALKEQAGQVHTHRIRRDLVSLTTRGTHDSETQPRKEMFAHTLGNFIDRERDKIVGEGAKSKKKQSQWIKHVKAYQKKHDCTYREALTRASKSYKSGR